MIYATVGTMYLDFPRLINKVDEIAAKLDEEAIIQIGMGRTFPKHCEYFDFRPREEILDIQRRARVIVCHAGIGSIIDALQSGQPLVFVPRLKKFKEHNSDHQLELAHAVQRRNWGRVILDEKELREACTNPPAAHRNYAPARTPLIDAIRANIRAALSRGRQTRRKRPSRG